MKKEKHCDKCSHTSEEGLVISGCAYCGCHNKETLTTEEKEFFNKLADKLEELFPKGEKCQCGRKKDARSKALVFNAWANIVFRELWEER